LSSETCRFQPLPGSLGSKTHPHCQKGITIVFQLAEKSIIITTKEEIYPSLNQPVVIDFIACLWPQVAILVGGRIIGKTGKGQVLVKQQLGQPQGKN